MFFQDRVHECVVNHTRFGQWYVSNNQLALFRSDIHRPSQVVQDEVIANADQIPVSGELAEMLENGDDDLTLNNMTFCESSVSISERLVEACEIASSRLRNDKEVDEALASAKKCFSATSQVGRLSANWRYAGSIFVSEATWGANRASRLEQDLLCDTHSAFIL